MRDDIAGVLMILGAAFYVLAALGTVRFPDVFTRMHAATKASTLGFLLIATGAAVAIWEVDSAIELLVAVALVFLTAPIAAHLVGRAAYGAPGVSAQLDVDELSPTLKPGHEAEDRT